MKKILYIFCTALSLLSLTAKAADESYIQTLSGNIKKGDTCAVTDDKYFNLTLEQWNALTHQHVENNVFFELRQDTSIMYYKTPFSCTVNLSIKYFKTYGQQQPDEINNVELTVKYDTALGAVYPALARHSFKDAFKVIVEINSITSKELGQNLPAIFRIRNQIIVQRIYPFNSTVTAGISKMAPVGSGGSAQRISPGVINQYQVGFFWDPTDFIGPVGIGGPTEYDVEWTYIDEKSTGPRRDAVGNPAILNTITDQQMGQWMDNDNTRVTVPGTSYTIELGYPDGFIVVRVRGVAYDPVTNVRLTTNWQYRKPDNSFFCEVIAAHENSLNWQYTASYAEEGKRKGVISYFDGSMRNRQTVTVNNSDNTSVAAETIYDKMGRPTMSILPSPVINTAVGDAYDHKLKFYPAVNKNMAGQPYSYSDFLTAANCGIKGDEMSTSDGASNYYSPQNPYINSNTHYYTNYVPDASRKPFSITEYTPDNTGRIRRQSGVGPKLEIGTGHETQYFYGKPTQKDLDRLFGSEAGVASHYLKNMVIDPNGQASISYVNAAGKTVATALAGKAPGTLDQLSSAASGATARVNEVLIRSADFSRDASALQMQANATFLAATGGNYKIKYQVNPANIKTTTSANVSFCSNCYYTVLVKVTNECGDPVASKASEPFLGNDVTCAANPVVINDEVSFDLLHPGEYHVSYTLTLSEDIIKERVDSFVAKNSDLKTLQTFFHEQVLVADLNGCYTECTTCLDKLGLKSDFVQRMNAVLTDLRDKKYPGLTLDLNHGTIQTWIDTTYDRLLANCVAKQPSCGSSACDDKLDMMKIDVRPGGQYAMFDEDTYAPADVATNIIYRNGTTAQHYKLDNNIPNYEFTDADGVTRFIKDAAVTNQVFMLAYVNHPEWADAFVKRHIEYCSYLFCKNHVSDSYTFDDMIREGITDGQMAADRGLFNRANYKYLLDGNKDPFFASSVGSTYKAAMEADLANLSTVLKFTPVAGSSAIGVKNILQYVDWILYNRPVVVNSQTDLENAWNQPVNADCRSLTQEWEMYTNYYLQLKSKYVQMAKAALLPDCKSCFIGNDGFDIQPTTCSTFCQAPTVNVYSSQGTRIYSSALPNSPVAHTLTQSLWKNTCGGNLAGRMSAPDSSVNTNTNPGVTTYPCEQTNAVPVTDCGPLNRAGIWLCIPPEGYDYPPINKAVTLTKTINITQDKDYYFGIASDNKRVFTLDSVKYDFMSNSSQYEYWDIFPIHLSVGPHTFSLSVVNTEGPASIGLEIYNNTEEQLRLASDLTDLNIIYSSRDEIGHSVVACPRTSQCNDNPLRSFYQSKKRVWDDADINGYLNCLAGQAAPFGGVESVSYEALRQQAIADLAQITPSWGEKLKAMINDENEANVAAGSPVRFPTDVNIINTVVNAIVANLYEVAKKAIELAPVNNLQPASSLPPGQLSANGHNNFMEAFLAVVSTDLVQKGFGPHLLEQPYPYDRTPIVTNPIAGEIPAGVCANITTIRNRFYAVTPGGSNIQFHNWLKANLGYDYQLKQTELDDLLARCANNCRLLDKAIRFPIAFLNPAVSNPDHPSVNCTRIANLKATFTGTYLQVAVDTRLYHVLFTNFLNANLGYALSYAEYAEFLGNCSINNNAGNLYNKPTSPTIPVDGMACVKDMMAGVFERAGQEYQRYIDSVRLAFRNQYVSKCLSNRATANLDGQQYEYHYTLYYYDQAGNLIKTIPPEGVKLLTDAETDLVEEYRNTQGALRINVSDRTNPGGANALVNVSNNFTTEFWVWPLDIHAIDAEATSGYAGDKPNHNYAIAPTHGGVLAPTGVAGTGVSVGTNGISIVEHAANYIPATLVWSGSVNGWTHVAIVYNNRQPSLYVNGVFVRQGLQSPMATVIPSYNFNGFYYGSMRGTISQVMIWNSPRTAAQITADMANPPISSTSGLVGYWPMADRTGNIAHDINAGNNDLLETTNYSWIGSDGDLPANQFLVPQHGLPTNYAYNSLNQVVKQTTPDAGTSEFFYDRLGRLFASQNAEQKLPAITTHPANRYSYTRYDGLGRITEVGEKLGTTVNPDELNARSETFVTSFYESGSNREVTVTAYDQQPAWAPALLANTQTNLRKRVAATALLSVANVDANPNQNREAASYYSYDITGNVHTLVQENAALAAAEAGYVPGAAGLKKIKYEYDLVSGKVNKVLYQDGKWDQFYYQYLYDADNRLSKAFTSRQNTPGLSNWLEEANYHYYLHGPLARMELGNQRVQGVDYAYTLQGWLKGVNSPWLNPNHDPGHDSKQGTGALFDQVSRDLYGFQLGYFADDYHPIGGGQAYSAVYQHPAYDATGVVRDQKMGKELFNGNISYSVYNIGMINNNNQSRSGYTYRYDQLNRLTAYRAYVTDVNWNQDFIIPAYAEDISYDANGNIKTYNRDGQYGAGRMDELTYGYNVDNNGKLVNNRLRHVKDVIPAGTFGTDIDNQADDNYEYDKIGNLIKDPSETIGRINWTVYGKIKSLTKGAGINYGYDAGGNRITKKVGDNYTFYIRDAQGNVLGIYEKNNTNFSWAEQQLYGSSRLGTVKPGFTISSALSNDGYTSTNDPLDNGMIGRRSYDLTNHLGNVLSTIQDSKYGADDDGNGQIDEYRTTVLSARDYYPFGMTMAGRSYQPEWGSRYGFNGKENDKDIYGEGNAYDFDARIYDSRVGRFLSVDPKASDYVALSSYASAANNPVALIDVNGEGAEDPPGHIVTAIKAYSTNFYNALYVANNTSNRELYFWAMGNSNDESAYGKIKGAVGEAIFMERANNLAAIGIKKKGSFLGVPAPHYQGATSRYGIATYQVDVQAKLWTGPTGKFLGLPSFVVKAGVVNNNFDGSLGSIAQFGSSWHSAKYTFNYEVKALSPANTNQFNFDIIKKGVQQAINIGQGKNTIGILVVDKEAWTNVANDPSLGPQLREEYNKLNAKDSNGEKNFLRLESGLGNEAQRGAYGLRDEVIKAENKNNKSKNKK